EDDRPVGRDRHGGRERLGDAEGEQLLVRVGKRARGDIEEEVVLPEAEGEGDAEDGDADDDPGPQLVEVLDEAEAVVGGDRPDAARHRPQLRLSRTTSSSAGLELLAPPGVVSPPGASRRRGSSSSSPFSPLTLLRNSRMPRPRL